MTVSLTTVSAAVTTDMDDFGGPQMSKIKLSKPQLALLETLPQHVVDSYAPAIKLVALGLAEWVESSFLVRLVASEAGKAHLENLK